MKFFNFSSKSENSSQDKLGVYPVKMQVPAIPERRYLRTSRLLAVFIIVNLAVLIALGGIYVYLANRVDVSISNRRVVNLFAIDPEQKVIKPAEHAQGRVNALQIAIEGIVRDYIQQRHSVVWDNDIMAKRIDRTGYVAAYSSQQIFEQFQRELNSAVQDSRNNGYVRDVHLYDVKLVGPDLWQGIFDAFDMPVPDSMRPLCGACQSNAPTCIACKKENAFRHRRYKVYLKTNFAGTKGLANPLGILVYSYALLYMPVRDGHDYWDVPAPLRPDF